ncbi:MAG: XTP/dITP diphosphatase [Bacillota bacterium]|jgi:XTP/dITP diphosphohydrolase
MTKIIVATRNEGKIREFKSLLENKHWIVYSLKDFPHVEVPEENGRTFRENALIKAAAVASSTGMVALGDDSGLEVDYLDGSPGVYSARFSGEEANDQKNNEKLLGLMSGVPEAMRRARFRCVIAIVNPWGETHFCEGVCEGIIASEPAGNNGFGYDPLFWLPQYKKTMAQLSMEEKNLISHRSQAFKKALVILEKLFKAEE